MKNKYFVAATLLRALLCVSFIFFMAPCDKAMGAGKAAYTVVDHSDREILQQTFARSEDVTRACLSCHVEAAAEVQKTIHWTMIRPTDPEKKTGKAGISFNNFCISLSSNEPRCTSCHVGYGFGDKNFSLGAVEKVDCLVCHDLSGNYRKFPAKGGYPVTEPAEFEGVMYYPPDYAVIFKSLGLPGRNNCGSCHFFGGGGDGVKHGDLDSSLGNPSRELDVHMSPEGGNLRCQDCHVTRKHLIAAREYGPVDAAGSGVQIKAVCTNCHGQAPHKDGHKANNHVGKVSCQTCHIPAYARKNPTKMSWDWSAAGKLKDGKPYLEKDADGNILYDSKKGVFTWGTNIKPVYKWYSGTFGRVLFTDEVSPETPVDVKKVLGTPGGDDSRIMPFKPHRGKQPFDPVLKRFLAPHIFGNDDTAYWTNFDWPKALKAGQDALGLPWSGKYTFVETVYYQPITHMVAPKEQALKCSECHSAEGRLSGLAGTKFK